MMDLDTFLGALRATLIPGKAILHQGSWVFPDVILASNYHTYKEKTKNYYHTTVSLEVIFPPRKIEPLFSGSLPEKNTKPPGCPFSSIPLKNFKLSLS